MMILPTGRCLVRNAERGRRRAFTLVELIVVMTLLAVVISVSAPMLGKFFLGRTLESEARRLLALTRYGQSRAASEGVPMVLWADANERTYGLQMEQGYEETDTKAVGFELGKDVELDVVHLDGSGGLAAGWEAVVRFEPDGGIGDGSAEGLRVVDRDGVEIWLVRSLNRLNYEIATNAWRSVRR